MKRDREIDTEQRMAKQESVRVEIGEELELRENNAPRINRIAPAQVVDASAVSRSQIQQKPRGLTCSIVFKIIFFAHLLGIAILVSFLSIRGFFSKTPAFDPPRYFIPLLSSSALSAVAALIFLLSALHHPRRSLDTSLWLSPVLTCLAGALLLVYGTGISFAFGVPALVLGLAQSFYACWINPRVRYAHRILSASVSAVKPSVAVGKYAALALVAAAVYSWFWILGVGALAASDETRFDAVYLLLLLLSLAWTMQVIRNVVHVAVAHVAYTQLRRGSAVPARDAFRSACGRDLGDICVGSALAPTVGTIRAVARAIDLISGDSDEFMFSCAGCYLGVSDRLVAHGNRWGFVHVGARGKGFGEASEDTWGMFEQHGMRRLIDSDLTGSFCFFCGAAGGSFAALACGSWMLAVDVGYATGPTVYAFIVGYFMVRIGMAWAQACVSAYHVVYAEDPRNNGMLGSVIAERIREMDPPLET